MDLKSKKCVPCEGGLEPLNSDSLQHYSSQLQPTWDVVDGKMLRREFTFPDFKAAMAFANEAAFIAEEEGHHPDLHISWGKVVVWLYTHAINGLSENDFIVAAKLNELKT